MIDQGKKMFDRLNPNIAHTPKVVGPVQEPVAFSCLRCATPKKCAVYGCSPNTWPSESSPKRPWVGLTDLEIDQGLLRTPYAMKTAEAWREGVRWAYHQLKEKNT